AAVANGDKTASIKIKNDGNITEVTKGDTTNYFGWIGKDVLVLPKKSGDKSAIARWTSGKGAFAKSDAARLLAKTTTTGAVWFAGDKPKGADLGGADFQTGYGAIKYGSAMYDVELHGQLATAASATAFVANTKQQLEQGKKLAAVSPQLNNVLNAVFITSADTDVSIKAKIGESDLLGVLALIGN
ncbi:MAG TPA: hypothetical protein VGC42_27390, partial [Kofleriaceae bacterium]